MAADSRAYGAKGALVVALAGAGKFPSRLDGFEADGSLRFEVDAPPGCTFSYVTRHPSVSLTVVCLSDVLLDGRHDWHFAIDPKTGALSRYCPAY